MTNHLSFEMTIDDLLSLKAPHEIGMTDGYSLLELVKHGHLDEAELCHRIRRMEYSQFLKTPYWQLVTWLVVVAAGEKCRLCEHTQRLVAHHRTYRIHGREHRHLDDLTCLCRGCHHRHHITSQSEKPVHKHDEVESPIEERDGHVVLTRERLDALRTNGAFTTATIVGLGVLEESKVAGWVRRIDGQLISNERYEAGMAGVGVYSGKRKGGSDKR